MFGSDPLFDHIERIARLGSYRWAIGGVPEWSPGLFRVLGYEPNEVTPSAAVFFERVHKDDVARLRAVHSDVLRGTGGIVGAPFRIVLPSGEVRVLRSRAAAVDEEGGARVLIGTIADITDEQRARQAIEDAEALLDDVGELTGVGHFVLDADLQRVVRSVGMRRLLGVTDVASTPKFDIAHPDDRERNLAWLKRGLAGETLEPLLYRVVHPDGTVRTLEARARMLTGDTSVPRLVGVVVDITERALLEERMRELSKLEAIGTLAAGVAHDFNNYLTVVAGQLELARDAGAPAPAIDAASAAVHQCALLTRQLLAFSRRQPSDTRTLDLGHVLAAAMPALRAALGPRIDVTLEPAAAPIYVRADPGQLESVLSNLAFNARDAMPSGGSFSLGVVIVDIGDERSREGIAAGRFARIRVKDSGGGIAPEVLPRIFEPYFTTKAPAHGSGLGLASTYGTVRQHGGFIDVASDARGTTFDVFLPLAEAAVSPAAPAASRESLAALSVLIVDDLSSVRELAALFLRTDGVRTLTAESAARALAILDAERVDLVLTDVMMPGLSGLELARAIAGRPGGPDVLFMTGYTEQHDLARLPAPVVKKPFDADALRRALAEWLAVRRAR